MKYKFIRSMLMEADKGAGGTGSAGSEDNTNTKGGEDLKGGNDPDKKDEDSGEEKKTYSDEDVQNLLAGKDKESKMAMLKALGFKSEKEALDGMKKYKEWQDSQKTDEEKRKEKEQQANEELQQAKNKAELAEAKVEAMKLGAKPDCVDDVIALAIAKKTDDGDFKTVIAELKKKYVSMFEQGSDSDEDEKDKNKKAGQKGTGGNIKKEDKNKKNENENSLGKRLAASKRISKKSSFFNN